MDYSDVETMARNRLVLTKYGSLGAAGRGIVDEIWNDIREKSDIGWDDDDATDFADQIHEADAVAYEALYNLRELQARMRYTLARSQTAMAEAGQTSGAYGV